MYFKKLGLEIELPKKSAEKCVFCVSVCDVQILMFRVNWSKTVNKKGKKETKK